MITFMYLKSRLYQYACLLILEIHVNVPHEWPLRSLFWAGESRILVFTLQQVLLLGEGPFLHYIDLTQFAMIQLPTSLQKDGS